MLSECACVSFPVLVHVLPAGSTGARASLGTRCAKSLVPRLGASFGLKPLSENNSSTVAEVSAQFAVQRTRRAENLEEHL